MPSGAKRRKSALIIGIVGALIALIAFGLFQGGWLGGIIGIITLIITGGVVHSYESSEVKNLQSSLELHSKDLDRLQENYQTNEAILARMAVPPIQVE